MSSSGRELRVIVLSAEGVQKDLSGISELYVLTLLKESASSQARPIAKTATIQKSDNPVWASEDSSKAIYHQEASEDVLQNGSLVFEVWDVDIPQHNDECIGRAELRLSEATGSKQELRLDTQGKLNVMILANGEGAAQLGGSQAAQSQQGKSSEGLKPGGKIDIGQAVHESGEQAKRAQASSQGASSAQT